MPITARPMTWNVNFANSSSMCTGFPERAASSRSVETPVVVCHRRREQAAPALGLNAGKIIWWTFLHSGPLMATMLCLPTMGVINPCHHIVLAVAAEPPEPRGRRTQATDRP